MASSQSDVRQGRGLDVNPRDLPVSFGRPTPTVTVESRWTDSGPDRDTDGESYWEHQDPYLAPGSGPWIKTGSPLFLQSGTRH